MRPEQYRAKELVAFLKRHKIATLDQLKKALGDPAERTVFRKLEAMSYLSSYSHRGKYYTLQGIAKFDAEGLWSCRSVWFSRFGNLIETVQAFVERSEAGYRAGELKAGLGVETKHTLVGLTRRNDLEREKIHGSYVYFSTKQSQRRRQRKKRQHRETKPLATVVVANPNLASDEAKAAILLFISSLDEHQRRLYAGLESLKMGYGGDEHIAQLFGMDPHTVARGRQELVEGDWDRSRLRAPGGGRPWVKKKLRKSSRPSKGS
jgi:hypothetical protein